MFRTLQFTHVKNLPTEENMKRESPSDVVVRVDKGTPHFMWFCRISNLSEYRRSEGKRRCKRGY